MTTYAFDESTHSYYIAGEKVPSVTEVLSIFNDYSKIPYHVLEAARERGTLVHKAGELLIQNRLEWSSIDGEIQSYMLGLQRFLKESRAVVTAAEMQVYHPRLKYGGTLDALLHWREGYCLGDWKTSLVLPKSVELQLCAYAEAYKAFTGRRIRRHYAIQLLPNDYQVTRTDKPTNLANWISALNCWKYAHGKH